MFWQMSSITGYYETNVPSLSKTCGLTWTLSIVQASNTSTDSVKEKKSQTGCLRNKKFQSEGLAAQRKASYVNHKLTQNWKLSAFCNYFNLPKAIKLIYCWSIANKALRGEASGGPHGRHPVLHRGGIHDRRHYRRALAPPDTLSPSNWPVSWPRPARRPVKVIACGRTERRAAGREALTAPRAVLGASGPAAAARVTRAETTKQKLPERLRGAGDGERR